MEGSGGSPEIKIATIPISVETENPKTSSTFFQKIEKQKAVIQQKNGEKNKVRILAYDIDGTVYTKEFINNKWVKKGDNKETSAILEVNSIPGIAISGRPDWDENSDKEMELYGMKNPDVVVSGAGTLIYWRKEDGSLELDQEYLSLMKNQEVKLFNRTDGKKELAETKTTYNAEEIRDFLKQSFELEVFKTYGLTNIKVDNNKGLGFTTLDLKKISFKHLGELIKTIRMNTSGLKVHFSEDLEDVSGEYFTGWLQIIPQEGGKDGALRYIAEKTAQQTNSTHSPEFVPEFKIVGDASIDIWMLAMGVSKETAYTVDQYGVKPTPHADEKLRAVIEALSPNPKTEDEKEMERAKRAKLHMENGWSRANLKILDKPGPEGILAAMKNAA